MTRYLRSDLLAMTGTARFDDWAASFGNVTQKNKINQAGQMQLKTSFSSFKNMPELMQMYKEFADLVPAERLPDTIKRPDLITGKGDGTYYTLCFFESQAAAMIRFFADTVEMIMPPEES